MKLAGLLMHAPSTVPLGNLRRADYNPRTLTDTERATLRASLTTYGFVEPVVARAEDLLLVGGHQRIDVLEELLFEAGATSEQVKAHGVPCVLVPGLSDAKAKALNLALNRIGGEWEYTKLADVLQSIAGDVDLVTGFGADEVSDILALVGAGANLLPPGTRDPDEVLAAKARHFRFDVDTDEQARAVVVALQACGMTGKKNAGAALVELARRAMALAAMAAGTTQT